MHRPLTIILLALALILPSACRSRVKPRSAPDAAAAADTVRVQDPAEQFTTRDSSQAARQPVSRDIDRIARERGDVQDAFFAFDSSLLDDRARAALATSSRWLKDNPNVIAVIEGHCDERGTEQYNLALGDRRAHAAREYLIALGIDPRRLSQISYGEERPFADGTGEQAWSQNRRAHLRLQTR